MKNKRGFFKKHWALTLGVILLTASFHHCVFMKPAGGPKVLINLQRDDLGDSTILVFNFKEPGYATGAGRDVAEMFHLRLLETRKFKVVSLYEDSTWDRIDDTEEKRLMVALQQAKQRDFDYILVGDLKEYYYGGLNASRVKMKIRVIEVKTKTTTFLANHSLENKGKDPSYPMQTKLSKQSQAPKTLAMKMVRLLVDQIGHRVK